MWEGRWGWHKNVEVDLFFGQETRKKHFKKCLRIRDERWLATLRCRGREAKCNEKGLRERVHK